MIQQERELKFALATVQDYEKLRRVLPNFQKTTRQRNFYFDTPSRHLAARRIMLRVREEAGEISICLKRNAQVAAGYFRAEEITHLLDQQVWEKIKTGSLSLHELSPLPLGEELIGLLQSEPLHILGSIETERSYFWHEQGFCIELDRVRMSHGEEEYEVEVETEKPETPRSFLLQLFAAQQIAWEEQKFTKYERFLHRHR